MTSPDSTPTADKSLGDLVSTATRDLSTLVRGEIQLAKVEIKREVTVAGKGAGLLGGAGFLGVFALVFLSVALAFALGKLVSLGWGFFIVGLLYLVVAGVAALIGKKSLTKIGPPAKTISSVKDDLAWAKHPTQSPTATTTTGP